MIEKKIDLKMYLESDRRSFDFEGRKTPISLTNEWKYVKRLRKAEYHANRSHNFIMRLVSKFYRYRLFRWSQKIGVSIAINTVGPGLCIVHGSSIFINKSAKIGYNCRIYNGVNIASGAVIGNNVYIAPGVKILKNAVIGNDVTIGANSVVHGTIEGDGLTIAGVPARIIDRERRDVGLVKGYDPNGREINWD